MTNFQEQNKKSAFWADSLQSRSSPIFIPSLSTCNQYIRNIFFVKVSVLTLDPRGVAPRRLQLTSRVSNYSGPRANQL